MWCFFFLFIEIFSNKKLYQVCVCGDWLVFWSGLGNVLVRGMGITKSSKESRMTWFYEMVWKGKMDSWKTTSLDTRKLLSVQAIQFVSFINLWVANKNFRYYSRGKLVPWWWKSGSKGQTTKTPQGMIIWFLLKQNVEGWVVF